MRKYKGLEIQPDITEIKKAIKGKTGIPIKYEDIN